MEFFAPVRVERAPLAGGGFVLRSTRELGTPPRCVGDMLEHWAARAPDAVFLAERGADGEWLTLRYGEALRSVRALARALLELGLGPTRPLLLLSGNGIEHALLSLAAQHVGVPAAPISTAFSLLARDAARVRSVCDAVRPGALFAADESFARAVEALPAELPVLTRRSGVAFGARRVLACDELRWRDTSGAVDEAFARVQPDTVAKILFTSGSTGRPKGVVNTQRMLCSNQHAISSQWPFLKARAPRVVDWLPWSHTFGGNHNFNMVLWHGGALYIDAGKPLPGMFDTTLRNLREIAPTVYFNVPRAFDLLAAELERDALLARNFFGELELLFYAASALPQSTWERLERASLRACGSQPHMVSAWGSTETAPMVTQVHFDVSRAGVIGLPIPGCELAFVPSQERFEMRVKGPNVAPGYWLPGGGVEPLPRDEHGFYPMGDAGRLVDDAAPERGVIFDGRTAENFKLSSGTWVRVGELRVALIAACAPLVQDVVIAGHDRDELGALLFVASARPDDPRLRQELRAALRAFNARAMGSSGRVGCFAVASEPPDLDAGEITDKGYVNQRAVLARRSSVVERMFQDAGARV